MGFFFHLRGRQSVRDAGDTNEVNSFSERLPNGWSRSQNSSHSPRPEAEVLSAVLPSYSSGAGSRVWSSFAPQRRSPKANRERGVFGPSAAVLPRPVRASATGTSAARLVLRRYFQELARSGECEVKAVERALPLCNYRRMCHQQKRHPLCTSLVCFQHLVTFG